MKKLKKITKWLLTTLLVISILSCEKEEILKVEEICCYKITNAAHFNIPGSPPWGFYTATHTCNGNTYSKTWTGHLPFTDENGCLPPL